MTEKIKPFRSIVTGLVQGKYKPGSKPLSWDDRSNGVDIVLDVNGEELVLDSRGDQSTPDVGWEIFIDGKSDVGFTWTLYGIQKQ